MQQLIGLFALFSLQILIMLALCNGAVARSSLLPGQSAPVQLALDAFQREQLPKFREGLRFNSSSSDAVEREGEEEGDREESAAADENAGSAETEKPVNKPSPHLSDAEPTVLPEPLMLPEPTALHKPPPRLSDAERTVLRRDLRKYEESQRQFQNKMDVNTEKGTGTGIDADESTEAKQTPIK